MKVLAAAGGMDDLGDANRGQIAVALVGEDERVGPDPPDSRRDGGRSPVRRLDEVESQVVVGEDGAADRRDADRILHDTEFGDDLHEELVEIGRAHV